MTAWGPATILRHQFPGWGRFIIAFAVILLGQLALTIKGSLHRMVKSHGARSGN
jgi:hypothetical protein